jgi:chaperonin GroEL
VQHRKVKAVSKVVVPEGETLDRVVLETMKRISSIVGSTLGPGGKQVLIERQEFGVPNLITKDGVTVFRNLGFNDPVAHAVMEAARDASVRTATEAGDGTTTATVLSEAFVRLTHEYCKRNPKISPQRVVRTMEKVFRSLIEPALKSWAMVPDEKLLYAVAKCSANGDTDLADAIRSCFELVGDDGNVTLTEQSGPSGYRVEQLKGYPVATGYEDCCGKFFTVFVNDQTHSRVYLEKPVFILYHGTITEFQTVVPLLEKIGERWGGPSENKGPSNVIIVATGFSDNVIGDLATNWPSKVSLNVYPVVAPRNIMQSGQLDFLQDLQAVTSSTIFDPVTRPLQQGELEDVGNELEYFEAFRWRTNIVGHADPDLVVARVEELQAQLEGEIGIAEKTIVQERVGKLTGGIAKLIIVAPTSGELREKRDRAEDAACAWRGAVKHGALPGGGWGLLKAALHIIEASAESKFIFDIVMSVMVPAMEEPVRRLLQNCGYTYDEVAGRLNDIYGKVDDEDPKVFDALDSNFVLAKDSGVMDSLPAVLEALRNSISIASLLGTLGGTIVFPRDNELERREAQDNYEYMRNAGMPL